MSGLKNTRKSIGCSGGPGARRVVNVVILVMAIACGPTSQLSFNFGDFEGEPSLKMKAQQSSSLDQGLVVLFATPRGAVSGQPEISVSFNHPMKGLGKADQDPYLDGLVPFKLEPAIEGEYRWMGSRTVMFAPEKPVPQATTFTATIPAGLRSVTGEVLEEDYSWTFETPPPEVVSSDPYAGEQWGLPDRPLVLYFNQKVDPGEVQERARLTAGGTEVGFKVERFKKGDRKSVRIVPKKDLPLDSDIVLEIARGLVGLEGPRPMSQPYRLAYRTYGPLEVVAVHCWSDDPETPGLECDPEAPVEVELTNPVPTEDLEKHVKVQPAPKGLEFDKWSAKSRHLQVYPEGHWKPGHAFEITLSAKLRDAFGQKLQGERSCAFQTLDFSPRWTMKFDGGLLEASGSRMLPISVLNVERLDAYLLAETRQEKVVPLVERIRRHGTDWMMGKSESTRVPLSYPKVKNRSALAKLDLKKSSKGKAKKGVVVLRIHNPAGTWDHESRIVRISDLGITAKVSGDRVLAWVTDLATGKAVAGARVTIRGRDNTVLWEGVADDRGVAVVSGKKLWKDWYSLGWEERCPYVFASSGGDFNYVNTCTSDGVSSWNFDVYHDENAGMKELAGLVFTERGVYRRGETVRLKGMLRYLEKGRLSVPGDPFDVSVTDSRGEEIYTSPVKTNSYGGFDLSIDLPPGGHLGYHSIRVVPQGHDGSGRMTVYGSFDVQEYRAPTFQVDVKARSGEVVRGDEIGLSARGEFLFGAPMAGSEASWYASGSRGWFDPPGWDGYTFDDGEYWYGRDWDDPCSVLSHSGQGVLDEKGTLPFAFTPDDEMRGPVDYSVETTVTGPDLQTVSGRTRVRMHPASFYLGLRTDDSIVQSGKAVDVEVAAVDHGGDPVPGRKARLTLLRRQWQYVQSEGMYGDPYGSWKVLDKKVDTCKVVTAEKAVSCSFKIPRAGRYIVRAEARDEKGRETLSSTSLWSWGPGSVSWMGSDELVVKMHADKDTYAVGEKARILVENPFPEAEALVTVEHHGVSEVRRETFKDRAALVELDVTDSMRPNIFVSVALVRGRTKEAPKKGGPDPGKPAVRMGYLNLKVGLDDKRLDVAVKPEREEYRPGEEVEVEVQVRDHAGNGRQAEVTLFVVDEAVLMLTGYKAPDPMGHFYRQRELGVANADSRMNILVRRAFGTDKGEVGGGGGYADAEAAQVRKDFRTTVFFEPDLETDSSGKARVSFTLPDSLTRFRIMAVAATKDDSFGRGKADFRVAKPLLLKPALPRFARVGDAFEAGVVVHDAGSGSGTVTVTAECAGVDLVGDGSKEVDLPAGGSVLVRFGFRAGSEGVASFTFRVEGGKHEDAIQLRRPVHLPVVMETVATYGDTTETAVEALGKLEGVLPDAGGLKVRMASTAFVGLDRAIENLVRYPYGCAEQLTSRMVPMVALGEVVETFGLDIDMDEKRLAETVRTLQEMQHWNGGWSYFRGATCPYPWLSAYVLWGLKQAQKRGYSVDEEVFDGGAYFLTRVLRDDSWCYSIPAWWSEVSLATKAYIVYVLAEIGQPEDSYHDYLFEHRDELPLFAQLLLAGAIKKTGGDADQVDELMRNVLNQVKQTSSSAHLVENLGDEYLYVMHSRVRDTALALDVLLEIDPDHHLVSKMARWLMESRREDGTWGNTQNDAWALLAMTDYLRVREAEEPDFVAEVFFGDESLYQATFEGRDLDEQSGFVPMESLLDAGGSLLGFGKKGAGRLYYSASLTYARDTLPEDPIDRGFFVERSYTVLPASGAPAAQKPSGKELGRMNAGENVIVELTIVVTGKRHFVAVEDPLPAGLEVVNFRFDTSSVQDLHMLGGSSGHPFYHSEILDDRVLLFADDIQPGIHRYRYLARATTPGEFVVAPAMAHEMYQPETFGRTGAGVFVVE
jgi:uncharacterized protein YfaS (alpha-2-macroglobulin family)